MWWECRGTCAQRKAVAAEGRSSALGFYSSVLLPSSLTCQKSKGVYWGVFSFFICVLEGEQGKPSWPFKLRGKKESSELSEIHIDRLETLDHLMAVLQLANDAQQHHQH